jgi:hypothetical protein
MTTRFYCAVSLIAALAAGGCGSKTYTGPGGEKVTVSKDGTKIEVQSAGNGNIELAASEKGVALPADFPKDVPIYAGATVVSSMKSNDGRMVTLQTGDTTGEVEEFYEKNLKDQGWEIENSLKMGEGTQYACKKEKRHLSASVSGSEKTMIVLVVQE